MKKEATIIAVVNQKENNIFYNNIDIDDYLFTMANFLYTSISRGNFTSNIWCFIDCSRKCHSIYYI